MSGPLILLGPQRPEPNAPAALASCAPGGAEGGGVVVISAGWRHDEGDEEVLKRHLGPDVAVLPLYAWFEVVMREHPELHRAYRARQDALVELKRQHRVRLDGALTVVHELLGASDPHGIGQLDAARQDVRRIDAQLLEASDRIHREIGRPWDEEPSVQRLVARALEILSSARAIVMAGGHVGVLRNRLDFFGAGEAILACHRSGTPIVAWSAGAMVLTERVILFYDDPPDGPTFPEILDRGLGLVPGLVLLPHARQRLRLDLPRRVELLASRFAPALCLGLENGAWLVHDERGWSNRGEAGAASWLSRDGSVQPLQAWAAP
ncbi:MAG TPA: hypothetical protein ENK18_10830 [Deltaproteobacteria bacterium]|nr:hypothetical protein [Deltaproteobacteria bacterium]